MQIKFYNYTEIRLRTMLKFYNKDYISAWNELLLGNTTPEAIFPKHPTKIIITNKKDEIKHKHT